MGQTSLHFPTSRCRFGVARCNVTPPVGMYHRMWGAALQDCSTGIHRPLTATAMAFFPLEERNASPWIILALDHCLLPPGDMHNLLERIAHLSGIPEEHIVVAFSHTHGAGYLSTDRRHLPGGDLLHAYLDDLPTKLSGICLSAWAMAQPAVITYGESVCGLGQNRDYWDDTRQEYLCGFNPEGVADQSLLVARVTDLEGNVLASVVNYGCHPTTLAWQNSLVSPDYVGALREVVEQATKAPCAFLLSPCGDVGPREQYTGETSIADKHGRQIGWAALSVWEGLPPPGQDFFHLGAQVSGATLGLWEYRPQEDAHLVTSARFHGEHVVIDVPYRPELPTLEQAEQQYRDLLEEEQRVLASGDEAASRRIRAMCERKRRQVDRVRPLPPGKTYPYSAWLWRLGDAFWIALEGEPYNAIQTWMRKRFAGRPIIINAIANSSRPSYLPTREAYSKPLYQTEIAMLASGCLEIIADKLEERMRALLAE